ncbi:MAG: DNA methyltransferase [Chloroflexota bacterium]
MTFEPLCKILSFPTIMVHIIAIATSHLAETRDFVTTVIWQKVYSPKNTADYLSEDHDYILVYTKSKNNWNRNLLPRTDTQNKRYINPDNDPRGAWKPGGLDARNYYSKGVYPITCPSGRIIAGPPGGSYWRVSLEKLQELDLDNRIWWGENGDNVPSIKRFISEVRDGIVPQTLWTYQEVGHSQEAKKELLQICDFASSDDVFITPKPTRLIQRILQIATDTDDLILDSFAGTGTTAQAVLQQNAVDGGKRRFILTEMEPTISQAITHQRVQRVIDGYAYKGTERTELLHEKLTVTSFKNSAKIVAQMDVLKKEHEEDFDGFETKIANDHITFTGKRKIDGFKEGLGGGFRYCRLGETLFDAEGNIRDTVSFTELARHVFFSETGSPLSETVNSPLIGTLKGTAIYLLYNGILHDIQPDGGNILTRALLATLPAHDGPKVIYANGSLLAPAYLQQHQITFRQTPYQIEVR